MVRLLILFLLLFPDFVFAQERLTIAVTASFKPVMEELADVFQRESGISIRLSSASSGILAQQIISGAPFDLFFSADAVRPEKVARSLNIPLEHVQPYAFGELVLISSLPEITSVTDLGNYSGKIIIANPAHAPYGVAAEEVLERVGFQGQRVQANNVVQARQYLSLALAPVGIIAKSVALDLSGQYDIHPQWYAAVVHKRINLSGSQSSQALLQFLATVRAVQIIKKYGYQVP